MKSCFGCPKHNEVVSLRAAVKEFEDGRQYAAVCTERDKAAHRYEELQNQLLHLKEENRSLKFSREVSEGNYERLLSDYLAHIDFYSEQKIFNTDAFYQRCESVVSFLNDMIVSLVEESTQKDAFIQKLKAQVTKDNTNSSIPASRLPNHKTPPNNRQKKRKKTWSPAWSQRTCKKET